MTASVDSALLTAAGGDFFRRRTRWML